MEITEKIIKSTTLSWYDIWVEEPSYYPFVDDDGEVWINANTRLICGYVSNQPPTVFSFANKEETKLYWRYYKAWQLMKR